MKSLKQIREASGGKEAYQKFFNSILKKFGVSSPSELEGDAKKKFYDAIDKGWDGDNEKAESVEEAKTVKLNRPEKHIFDLAMKAVARSNDAAKARTKRGVEKYMDYEGMDLIDDITGVSLNDDEKNNVYNAVRDALNAKIRESYDDEDDLDPETTANADEDQADTAVSQVTEKLKAGRGKLSRGAAIDIDYMGDRKDIKFDSTKWKINMVGKGDGMLNVYGDKQKIIAYLSSDDYGMDDEDIEDLFPELLENHFAKDLSVIRNIGEGFKKAYPVMDQGQRDKIIKIAKANSGNMAKAIKLIDKIKKGLSDNPDVMDLLKKANEDVNEGNRFSVKLKGDAKSLWQRVTVYKQSGKAKNTHGDKEWDAVVDKMAAQHRDDNHARISPKDIAAVKLAVKHESVTEAVGCDCVNCKCDPCTCNVTEAVSVDRRTAGFKEALKRQESAKKKRETAKLLKDEKKQQAELDSRYDYDGGVDTVLAAANAAMFGTKLPEDSAANNAGDGNVDMAPNTGKKKKKEILARRGY